MQRIGRWTYPMVALGACLSAGWAQSPATENWASFGRGTQVRSAESLTLTDLTLASPTPWRDAVMSFQARTPADQSSVQIWGALRIKDRDNRYVFGLRGGREPQISLAVYAPDNTSRFLGFAPLEFTPVVGEWYTLRVVCAGKRFQIYLNDEPLPRLNVEDPGATWDQGAVGLGGGWLPTEYRQLKVQALSPQELQAVEKVGKDRFQVPAPDKQALRERQRGAYQSVKIAALPELRGEFSLDGQWLFMPEQDLPPENQPAAESLPDQNWHTVAVPAFWTPTLGWLHGEKKLHNLPGLDGNRGPSDRLAVEELQRVNGQSFDWENTHSGWYRHYLELPGELKGRQLSLKFGAVAKICEIYLNGQKVQSHVGMFGEFSCDITAAAKPGRNVLSVHVVGVPKKAAKTSKKVQTVAVTVEVTDEMLNNLPHGMTDNNCSGIWQSVKLLVNDPTHLGEVYIKPRLDGMSATVEMSSAAAEARNLQLHYTIRDAADQSVLCSSAEPQSLAVPAGGKLTAAIESPRVAPKLWSPQTPNLYVLELKITENGRVVDEQKTRFGFRTFQISGEQFLLNGKPFWLRGGNHFPNTLRPNDGVLAKKFMQLARAGNVWVTRSHGVPFNETWLDTADEVGMGVSWEGTWPWLMIKGEPPSKELLKVWKEEFSQLMRQHRNHPSLLFWTVNNEMNFAHFDEKEPELLKRKWVVLDDMIRAMRQIDPTRPLCAYSGYTRAGAIKGFDQVVKPGGFDDGDIDDSHSYFGWYTESFFKKFAGEYGLKGSTRGRPLISQEMSTGYPRNDGWPSRGYEFVRYVPQTLVGNFAFEQNDPEIFLTRQAFMTKELAETIRRTNRANTAGVLHFAYLTWFNDVWDAQKIQPAKTYFQLKTALQDVLVSAELFGRHAYARERLKRRVCLVNDADDQKDLSVGKLTWQICAGGRVLSEGTQATPAVPYYTNQWMDVELQMPATLPTPRVDAQLVLTLEVAGRKRSENQYDLLVATRDWAQCKPAAIQYFGPAASLGSLQLASQASLEKLDSTRPLIVADWSALEKLPGGLAKFNAYVNGGGRALLLQPGKALVKAYPAQLKSYRSCQGEIVAMHLPESPIFRELQPLDLSWFEQGAGNLPYACSGTYEAVRNAAEVTTLADQCDLHSGMREDSFTKSAGAPLLEIRQGKGRILVSEMTLGVSDPVAGRLLANLVESLMAP